MMNRELIVSEIQRFCEDAIEVSIVLNGNFLRQFLMGQDEPRFQLDKVYSSKDFDLTQAEFHRSIICNNGDVLLTLDIDYHDEQLEKGLALSIKAAQKIEVDFPGQFLWTFSGRNIHGHALLKYNKDNERHIIRYGKIYDFAKALVYYLRSKHYINLDDAFYHYKGLNRSIGSYHNVSGLYKIPITLDMTPEQIIEKSARFEYDRNWEIPTIDMEYMRQIVPIYKPTLQKPSYSPTGNKKADPNFSLYPQAIITLMGYPKKGNKLRYDLLRYFLHIHKKSDVVHIMQTILTPDEYQHMIKEKQLEHIYARGYPPPTALYLENQYGLQCERATPIFLPPN